MINNCKHINSIGIIKIVNVILILNCPVVPNLSNGTVGDSSVNVSLTYLRGLEVPELYSDELKELINKKEALFDELRDKSDREIRQKLLKSDPTFFERLEKMEAEILAEKNPPVKEGKSQPSKTRTSST